MVLTLPARLGTPSIGCGRPKRGGSTTAAILDNEFQSTKGTFMPTVTLTDNSRPIRWWTDGVPVEDAARAQVEMIASMPFIHRHVAVMPDVHLGKGATVGSVIATKGAVIPAAVGVDIGCGMMAVRTSARAEDLPASLASLRSSIERAVPHGRTANGGRNDRGARHDLVGPALQAWHGLSDRFAVIPSWPPKIGAANSPNHMATLVTANHFTLASRYLANRVGVM